MLNLTPLQSSAKNVCRRRWFIHVCEIIFTQT